MADLYELDITYMMLPIDETPFAINANTRTITAPKVVALQKDQNAEMVIFTVDRYFDFMDLNNAEIWVQWSAPGKNGEVREGASEVEMRDIASIPGKIRFGWLLDDEITAEPGIVKYSVRFWNKGNINDEYGVPTEKVVYSLNTLTSSLTISPSLQPQLNDEVDINAPVKSNFFKRAIRNSLLTGEGIAVPVEPLFSEPGYNLPLFASLKDDNTLTLKAQAHVGDTGSIEYEWWYKPAVSFNDFDANVYYPFKSKDIANDDGTITTLPGFEILGGKVEDYYEAVIDLEELVTGEQYYVEAPGTVAGYKAYTGTTVPENEILYERYTTYKVPSGTEEKEATKVTGNYYVEAVNVINPNTSRPVSSNICQLVSPDDVVFTSDGDLPETFIMNGTNLIIKLEKQSRNATVTYLWEKGTDSNEIDELVENASTTSNQYTVTTPGWYQVTATASLNRESKFAESVVCKVTDMPKIPVTSYGINSASKIDEELNAPLLTDSEAILDLKVNSVIPARYMGYSEELFTEGLTYTWVTKIADSTDPARPLGPEDVGVLVIDGLGTPTLTIKSPEGRTTHMFKCLISNTLNGKTVTQLESDEDVLPFYVI